ncbi:MAG: FKBP-type peptidyl-prolyl cis-trans isomerase [Gammaproteobacteria bacterium]
MVVNLRTALCAGVLLSGAALLSACAKPEAEPAEPAAPALETDAAKAAYGLGFFFSENVRRQFGEDIEVEAFLRGARDQLSGVESAVAEAEIERVLNALAEARQAAAAAAASATLDEGLKYLADNAKREGVVALPSGLQYEVLTAAEGDKPKAEDTVTTHYEGRLIDGTVFDSSYQRDEPATFPLDRVIPGWTEGLQLMSPGAKYRLYVPAELAYGERGAPGSIPPNSTLVFDVELISIARAGDVAPESGATPE